MADDKKHWLGKDTFPTIWLWICVLFNWVGILALVMLIAAEFVIIVNNWITYHRAYGYSYPARGYDGEAGCGFVEYTNAPKHVGSVVWTLFYQLSIIVWASMALVADFAWRSGQYGDYGNRYVSAFYVSGIMTGERDQKSRVLYYVAANAWLKLFIVTLYMQQSFYGLRNGSHQPPASHESSSSSYGGGSVTATASASASASLSWKRATSDEGSWGVELWAFWSGWVVLGSIVPSVIAFMFLVTASAVGKKKDEPKAASA